MRPCQLPLKRLWKKNSGQQRSLPGLHGQHVARFRLCRPSVHVNALGRSFSSQGQTKLPGGNAGDGSNEQQSRELSATSAVEKNGAPSLSRPPPDWEDNPDFNISAFSQLPHTNFGVNQHMLIDQEFKEALRQILWQFRAPIRYAFAYGSGVFPQSAGGQHAMGKGKMIDLIFGVSYTQHWHSLNLTQHRDHYSMLGSLGSGLVTRVQDKWGAGVYFNPYVTVNGMTIKYGVVHLDTLCKDLSEWETLYLAGRLQKPVKILRDDPRVRLANQINLISALRTALLLLPAAFTEHQLYSAIAGISYLGDLRMSLRTENPHKVENIVSHQMANFRRLYTPLIADLPNVQLVDARCRQPGWSDDPGIDAALAQDMDPVKRGNMVQRLPGAFRGRLYFQFQRRYQLSRPELRKLLGGEDEKKKSAAAGSSVGSVIQRRQGGPFEQRIAADQEGLALLVPQVIKQTISWPSTSQTIKGLLTAGTSKTIRYVREKIGKWREGRRQKKESSLSASASSSATSVSSSSSCSSSATSSSSEHSPKEKPSSKP